MNTTYLDMSCSLLLGTHDIYNISVTSPSPGEVRVTGYLIDGSSTIGILVVVYSVTEDSCVHYKFVPHDTKQHEVYAVMMGPSNGLYKVTVYVMEESGLPFQRAAGRPRSVWINGNLLIFS